MKSTALFVLVILVASVFSVPVANPDGGLGKVVGGVLQDATGVVGGALGLVGLTVGGLVGGLGATVKNLGDNLSKV